VTLSFFVGFGLTACADGEQGDEAALQAEEAQEAQEGQAGEGEAVAAEEGAAAPAEGDADAEAAAAAAAAAEATGGEEGPQIDEAALAPSGDAEDAAPALPEEDSSTAAVAAVTSAPVDSAPAPVASAPTTVSGDAGHYTVQAGDTLGRIATRIYGTPTAWQQLASANNISAPYLIFPGDDLRFELSNEKAKQFAQKINNVPVKTVTVRNGDTLSGIAEKIYGNSFAWKQLAAQNKDKIQNPHVIGAGLVLSYMDPNALAAVVGATVQKNHVHKTLKAKTTVKAKADKPTAPPAEEAKEEEAPKAEEPKTAAKEPETKQEQPAADAAKDEAATEEAAAAAEEEEAPAAEAPAAKEETAKEETKEEPAVATQADPDPEIEDEAAEE